MTLDHFWLLFNGLSTTLEITFFSLFFGSIIAVFLTLAMVNKIPGLNLLARGIILIFTGTPLLIQIFLVYSGPSQFEVIKNSFLWDYLSQAQICAIIALAFNTAAYSSLLFKGAIESVPRGEWDACKALGMTRGQTLAVIVPHAIRRVLPSYSNEVILVLKGTSLASSITIMDVMGYANQINGQTYDALMAFSAAGIIYLGMNGILVLIFKQLEKKALAFQS
ncbi:MAG: arginine ABC transporter permease ArtM [Moritella sp.]|uniref:arginine ABC transporter permease ArtM n=1 Tax=Moritella sp. TaxID=78556 RepID=UPI0029A420D5|nr:arginine ABC transporter permease ArtM [Moritella sp.]MDX2319780.1 arginine ABC transporter permease ArtM [Moritella sp.]